MLRRAVRLSPLKQVSNGPVLMAVAHGESPSQVHGALQTCTALLVWAGKRFQIVLFQEYSLDSFR